MRLLSRDEARNYRAIAARLNYLAPDRLDIAFAVNEAARNMAKQTNRDVDKLKKIATKIDNSLLKEPYFLNN